MLIYNFEKNFLGIDEADLRILGFQDFASLRAEAADFADLFVKTPGYIHNFKHVHWIDFIACAESSDDSKVIIHANNKTFRCNLDLKTVYLIDSPTSKAYIITLQNLRELTNNENKEISNDIADKPAPSTTQTTVVSDVFNTSAVVNKPTPTQQVTPDPYEIDVREDEFDKPGSLDIIEDIYENSDAIELEIEKVPEIVKVTPPEPVQTQIEDEIEDDFRVDIDVHQEEFSQEEPVKAKDEEEDDGYDDSYIFDPNVASGELGLPVDLIEEFIQDFIAQAEEFKTDLYSAVENADMDRLKIQSHKLKGVAANLRIENAFNVLSVINSSSNISEIQKNLNIFYKIIAALSGKGSSDSKPKEVEIESIEIPQVELEETLNSQSDTTVEDELVIDFKDDFAFEEPTIKEEKTDDVDNLVLEFKDENTDDLYIDYEDKETPTKETAYEEELFLDLETPEPEPKIEPELTSIPEIKEEEEEIVAPSYDKKLAASEIGLDIDTFNELFLDYIEGCRASTDEINKAIEKDDPIQWRANAIQIKGMSDNMRVHDFTTDLETIIETKDKSVAQEALVKIESLIGKISDLGV